MKIKFSICHMWKHWFIFPYNKIEFSIFPIWTMGEYFRIWKSNFLCFHVWKFGCIFPYKKIKVLYFLFEIWVRISTCEKVFYISFMKIWVQIQGYALSIVFPWHVETICYRGCCQCTFPPTDSGVPSHPGSLLALLFVNLWTCEDAHWNGGVWFLVVISAIIKNAEHLVPWGSVAFY